MANSDALNGKLVVLVGGSGFFGTHIAQDLLERGARLRIASRNPETSFKLKPLANLGQLQFARCDVTRRDSLEASLQGADAVVYLVGTFEGNQKALQATGAGNAARIAGEQGAQAFVYVSAIGADARDEESGYAATKGLGEKLVLEAFPAATIVRPSIIFGEDDQFVNMFAGLVQKLPALPVFAPESKIQPLWVDDAAQAAEAIRAKFALGIDGAMVIANPVPEADALAAAEIDGVIDTAIGDMNERGISGKESTPFLLGRIAEKTGGRSLEANIALVLNNARVAAQIAAQYSRKRSDDPT